MKNVHNNIIDDMKNLCIFYFKPIERDFSVFGWKNGSVARKCNEALDTTSIKTDCDRNIAHEQTKLHPEKENNIRAKYYYRIKANACQLLWT